MGQAPKTSSDKKKPAPVARAGTVSRVWRVLRTRLGAGAEFLRSCAETNVWEVPAARNGANRLGPVGAAGASTSVDFRQILSVCRVAVASRGLHLLLGGAHVAEDDRL